MKRRDIHDYWWLSDHINCWLSYKSGKWCILAAFQAITSDFTLRKVFLTRFFCIITNIIHMKIIWKSYKNLQWILLIQWKSWKSFCHGRSADPASAASSIWSTMDIIDTGVLKIATIYYIYIYILDRFDLGVGVGVGVGDTYLPENPYKYVRCTYIN